MSTIYLLVGVPAAGKSWVAEQLRKFYHYVRHDDFLFGGYVEALLDASENAGQPVLAETPFSVSKFLEPLESEGREVIPVFIIADEDDLIARWDERGNVTESTRRGHLKRQNTYCDRAEETGCYVGTAEEVLEFLREKAGA